MPLECSNPKNKLTITLFTRSEERVIERLSPARAGGESTRRTLPPIPGTRVDSPCHCFARHPSLRQAGKKEKECLKPKNKLTITLFTRSEERVIERLSDDRVSQPGGHYRQFLARA